MGEFWPVCWCANITTIKIINLTITPSLLNSAYECIGPFAFPFRPITDLLCITINLLFLENCIRGIILCVLLVKILFLDSVDFRFFYVVCLLLFMTQQYPIVCLCDSVYLLAHWWTLDCFHLLAITSKTVKNFHVQNLVDMLSIAWVNTSEWNDWVIC